MAWVESNIRMLQFRSERGVIIAGEIICWSPQTGSYRQQHSIATSYSCSIVSRSAVESDRYWSTKQQATAQLAFPPWILLWARLPPHNHTHKDIHRPAGVHIHVLLSAVSQRSPSISSIYCVYICYVTVGSEPVVLYKAVEAVAQFEFLYSTQGDNYIVIIHVVPCLCSITHWSKLFVCSELPDQIRCDVVDDGIVGLIKASPFVSSVAPAPFGLICTYIVSCVCQTYRVPLLQIRSMCGLACVLHGHACGHVMASHNASTLPLLQ